MSRIFGEDKYDRDFWTQVFWLIVIACFVQYGVIWIADKVVRPLWEDAEPY